MPERHFSEEKHEDAHGVFAGHTGGENAGSRLRALALICILIGCYTVFVCFSMYKLGALTRQLNEFSFAPALAARQMMASLYATQNALPRLATSTEVPYSEIENMLRRLEENQDKPLAQLVHTFRDRPETAERLLEDVKQLRHARRQFIMNVRYQTDFKLINATYQAQVHPYFETLTALLTRIADDADALGKSTEREMGLLQKISLLATLLAGLFLIGLILYMARVQRLKTREIMYREKLFNLLSENIDDVFLIIGEDGFEYVSSNSRRIFGKSAGEIIRNRDAFYSVLAPASRKWVEDVLAHPRLHETAENDDIALAGSSRHFRAHIYPIYRQGELERYVLMLGDQTKAVAVQESLRVAFENAKSASAAKSDFLSRMSHEIRTPLNAIIGMTTIARQRLGDMARVDDCLLKISLSSRHLLGLVNDVLDMAKIEGGKLSVTKVPFSLNDAIQGIVNLVLPQAEQGGLKFEAAITVEENRELLGDPLRLNQILLNLLSNALKFTPRGGSIRLGVSEISRIKESVYLEFTVRDTGIGMSEEFLKKIYDPFEQASPMTSAKFGGTGLGMAITKNLVSLLGGTITAKSRQGEGSEFTVHLPFGIGAPDKTENGAHDPQGGAIGEPAKKEYDFSGKTILLVEDNEFNREVAGEFLAMVHADVEMAENGREAVEKFTASEPGKYAVILMDVQMPIMNGYEATRAIRASSHPAARDIPILAMTANAFNDDVMAALESGMNGHIAKPIDVAILYRALDEHITGNKPEQPEGREETGGQ